jgi:ankyrin repeat protein
VKQILQRAGKRTPPLLVAIQNKDVSAVRSGLLAAKSLSAIRDPHSKSTPLIACIASFNSSSNVEEMSMLLLVLGASAADIDCTNNAGDTALFALVLNANMNATTADTILQMLLASKPNMTIQNSSGATVFHCVCEVNNVAMLGKLIAANKNQATGLTNANGESCVHVCCRRGHVGCLEMLIKCEDAATQASVYTVSFVCSLLIIVVQCCCCFRLLLVPFDTHHYTLLFWGNNTNVSNC